MNLGVLDYGAGNLRSVLNAFSAIDHAATLVTRPEQFESIDILVFPGQGAFGDSVRILKETGLWEPLRAWLKAGRPYLGICLGYQLLFESSEECPGVEGLGVAPGRVRKFDASHGLEIPHMGWNKVTWAEDKPAWWRDIPNPAHLYFVHSYYPEVTDQSLALCQRFVDDHKGTRKRGSQTGNLFCQSSGWGGKSGGYKNNRKSFLYYG